MTFFNKKEEVLNVELTQFGKKQVSLGKFKPYCYRFFDDEVIYDTLAAGLSEHQNESEERIKDSAYPKLPALVFGVQTKFEEDILLAYPRHPIQNYKEKEKLLKYPLCEYVIGSEYAPAWNIKLIETEFVGSYEYVSQESLHCTNPTLKIEPETIVTRDFRDKEQLTQEEIEVALSNPEREVNIMEMPVTYLDNTKMTLEMKKVLMEIEEKNVPYNKENFEIEIYEVLPTEPGSDETLRRLETHEEISSFFEIYTDEEIEDDRIEKGKDTSRNFYMS